MGTPRLYAGRTAVLVVDMQEKLLPHMHESQHILAQTQKLLDGANALGVPTLVTQQYPQGLGPTVPQLASRLQQAVGSYDKLTFSACTEPVRETLAKLQARSVVVCGIEAHVCVLQTCLDLADRGLITAVAVDAIGSRRAADCKPAVSRMVHAGILPTTVESALLELVREAGTHGFKAVLPVIK